MAIHLRVTAQIPTRLFQLWVDPAKKTAGLSFLCAYVLLKICETYLFWVTPIFLITDREKTNTFIILRRFLRLVTPKIMTLSLINGASPKPSRFRAGVLY
jgi:hypothetical protein